MSRCFPSLFIIFLVTALLTPFSAYSQHTFQYSISAIPTEIKQKMISKTWHESCPVTLEDLAYIKLSYYGFDENRHMGHIIVHKQLAKGWLKFLNPFMSIGFL